MMYHHASFGSSNIQQLITVMAECHMLFSLCRARSHFQNRIRDTVTTIYLETAACRRTPSFFCIYGKLAIFRRKESSSLHDYARK